MEQSFADLLGDAFSETSVPSFPEEDLDFEDLNCDEKEDIPGNSNVNSQTKEEGALHQEEMTDVYEAESVDKEQTDDYNEDEDFQSVRVMSMDEMLEEDYTSSDKDSEQEGSSSGDDEEDENMGTEENPGDLLVSVCYSTEFCEGNKEDRIFDEGQPLAPEGAGKPQVRNQEPGESEGGEEVSYFQELPGRGREIMIEGDRIEEDEQEREEEKKEDSFDCQRKGMKVEQEENALALRFEQEVENPYGEGLPKTGLEFPEISAHNLQDLIAEVDGNDLPEKVWDFSGEEHQEAGESIADYPSDFSSCEYVKDGGKTEEPYRSSNALAHDSDSGSTTKQDPSPGTALADESWMSKADEDADEDRDDYLYSRDLELSDDRFGGLDVATEEREKKGELEVIGHGSGSDDGGETDESGPYTSTSTSSEDDGQVDRSDEDPDVGVGVDDIHEIPSGGSAAFSAGCCLPEDHNRKDPTTDLDVHWNLDDFTTLSEGEVLTTGDAVEAEKPLSDLNPAEDDVNSNANTSPRYRGSVDDCFDDDLEDDRNWEQEHERIKAFYDFYDDSDQENDGEGRQIRVQFCTNPLSEVIHFETDSSDRESLGSSTEGEEDVSSAEISEESRELDGTTQMEPACDPPNTQLTESEQDLIGNTTIVLTKKHKCLNVLKLTLKMCVVIATGLLMFWLATNQEGLFDPAAFF